MNFALQARLDLIATMNEVPDYTTKWARLDNLDSNAFCVSGTEADGSDELVEWRDDFDADRFRSDLAAILNRSQTAPRNPAPKARKPRPAAKPARGNGAPLLEQLLKDTLGY